MVRVLGQFKALLEEWRSKATPSLVGGHITITGGEPFMRRDFLDLLEILSLNKAHFSYAILTNGSHIDAATASRLRELSPSFVQVSIEGTESVHDGIRGPGSFRQAVSALQHLIRRGIRTLISFTAHRANFRDFAEVARLGRKLGVSRVWADRFVPTGMGGSMEDQVLAPDETHEFFKIMKRTRGRPAWPRSGGTEIAMNRALQFLVSGNKPYRCAAGDTLITIQPSGDLYPCPRMPIKIGNVLEEPLSKLYYDSQLFRRLRGRTIISDGCRGCLHAETCQGGLKCLSYAVTGDPFRADPGCWIAPASDRMVAAGASG